MVTATQAAPAPRAARQITGRLLVFSREPAVRKARLSRVLARALAHRPEVGEARSVRTEEGAAARWAFSPPAGTAKW